jgi:dynein heavy chain 1
MNSREGEQIPFEKSIRISENANINVWLSKIEDAMRTSLASNLERSLKELSSLDKQNDHSALEVVSRYPAQMVLLALQTLWCSKIENSFEEGNEVGLCKVENYVLDFLTILAESVLKDLKKDLRQKYEQIITDFVHQRDVTRLLIKQKVTSPRDFTWQYQQEQVRLSQLRLWVVN